MKSIPMKILIIEDDAKDCENFIKEVKLRTDIEIIGITDSDTKGLEYVKAKHPEGIVLDLELNDGTSGHADSIDFLSNLKELNLDYEPITIITTHINSKVTYRMLHKKGADLILYKDHPKYSSKYVLDKFIDFRKAMTEEQKEVEEKIIDKEAKISELIYNELDLIGISNNLKGRTYIHDAIVYLLENQGKANNMNVIAYLTKIHKKSGNTITNGIQNAIIHAWKITPYEEIQEYYKARVNYETGLPTTMEFLYYYEEKIKRML